MAKGQIKQKQATIKKQTFESLCGIQCTKEEICAVLNITDKTLDSWVQSTYNKHFSEVFREKRGVGKVSLRRMQWRLAEKNPSMAIFLGKQILGQKDEVRQETVSRVEIINDLKEEE